MNYKRLWGGAMLVAGMSIGVGMLALPVVTAEGGFWPSVFSYVLSWAFMFSTGLLIMEGCLRLPPGSNLLSLSRAYLGKPGSAACWLFYLFLFTCLMIAHTAAGGSAFHQVTSWPLPLSTLVYIALFSPIVLLGASWVAQTTALLMIGVFALFFLFVIVALPHLSTPLLGRAEWPLFWQALPVIVTAFGFQNLVPTLTDYLERDRSLIRKALLMGTLVPLSLYILWELIIIGIVPLPLLQEAATRGENGVVPLAAALGASIVPKVGVGFALFAMTTSFLCIAIAFVDFLADGLQIAKKGRGLAVLGFLVFGIPLVAVLYDPTLFLKALGLAGGLGAMFLFGILPVLISWAGRFPVRGGKFSLAGLFLFALTVIAIELFSR